MKDENTIKWLESWFLGQCDGEWKHGMGITIEGLDNPGWDVKIDLKGTSLRDVNSDSGLIEKSNSDWYVITIKDGMFNAYGDPTKLDFLLQHFKELVNRDQSVSGG